MVKFRGRYHHVLLFRVLMLQGDVEIVFYKFTKLWQILSSKHVSISLDFDHFGFLIVFESGVMVAPSAQLKVVDLDLTIGMIVYYLGVGFSFNTNRFF